MSDWIVGSIAFADPAGLADAAGLVLGKYWLGDVRVGAGEYAAAAYAFPGVDGVGLKRLGFRGRRVEGEVAYVAESPAALRTALAVDRQALEDQTFATTPPDGAELAACTLEAFPDGAVLADAGGAFVLRTRLAVRQVRL
ncbi:MAG: hypothetical protein AMXMBFR7_00550 [Planctomycetota bacterium]